MPRVVAEAGTLETIDAQRVVNIESLKLSIDNKHKQTAERRTHKKQEGIRGHNQKTGVQEVNVSVGDFVLLATRASKGVVESSNSN